MADGSHYKSMPPWPRQFYLQKGGGLRRLKDWADGLINRGAKGLRYDGSMTDPNVVLQLIAVLERIRVADLEALRDEDAGRFRDPEAERLRDAEAEQLFQQTWQDLQARCAKIKAVLNAPSLRTGRLLREDKQNKGGRPKGVTKTAARNIAMAKEFQRRQGKGLSDTPLMVSIGANQTKPLGQTQSFKAIKDGLKRLKDSVRLKSR
jgi:hypothetical protein